MNRLQAAEQLRRVLQMFAATLTEEQALEIATVFPEWKVNWIYNVGYVFSYGHNNLGDPQLYKVVQAHTSQSDWTPDSVPSLYEAFGLDEQGYPIWAQPSGAHDAYDTGDIVNYNGVLYRSLINGNVWSPDVYPAGWEKVTDSSEPWIPDPEIPDQSGGESVPEFVQPTGAHDAYKKGDHVMFEGKEYESLIDSNVWSPTAYPSGWQLVE